MSNSRWIFPSWKPDWSRGDQFSISYFFVVIPNGLSIREGVLWYSDADFPEAEGMRGYLEIGFIT